MRSLGFGLVVLGSALGLASGCGQSERGSGADGAAGSVTAGPSGSSAGQTGNAAAGSSGAGTSSSGGSGPSAGGSNGGHSNGGSSSGGSVAVGGQSVGQAGAGNEGRGAGLVDCDARKVLCKSLLNCDADEVPSVNGTCWGECVKIEQCACSVAEECPASERYTCWGKLHCGPFVQ